MTDKKKKSIDADDIEQIYQKKTQLEHILLRPDTYIGSVEMFQQYLWVFDQETSQIVYKQISYVPGLYKIFDEILVNAADNFQNDPNMNLIQVEIDPDKNRIKVWNNGKGIPVQIHKIHNCYVPDMIFGQLLTSSNYDDNKKKVTGGRNGFGAKLSNIFSTEFQVETADSKNGQLYSQRWKKNMSVREEPVLKPNTKKEDYTCVTFQPDLEKFKMDKLDDDIVSLMTKRVYDMAGCTPASVRVKLNGKTIEVKNFSSYVDMYLQTEENKQLPKIIEKTTSDRWEVIASLSDGQFQQVSFVNSICTIKGGSHVNYIADQITEKIMEVLKKKHKNIQVKPYQIKSNLWLFVNCLVENPAFDSQTKETLTTKPQTFGSTCELSEKFLKEFVNSGIVESIVNVAKAKEEAKLARTLGGKKKSKLIVPKLEDANLAGTKNSEECTIILTEGDSAKSLALAGIEVVGRDLYGVFPLRGKFLNVREASNKQIMENPEIQNLIKILGMQIGKKYEDTKGLRYGSIMIMTDQDNDGSHIKGLLINFIHHFWPSLIKLNGFLKEFVTPLLKATKGNEVHSFFTQNEFEHWAEGKNLKLWKIKYYKGLGTSTTKEAKEYFTAINTHQIEFEYQDNEDDEVIDLAFNKKLADKRKDWLTTYSTDQYVDHSQKLLRYKDFVNKELIQFSIADCQRSIPSLCDGLKPGQRKIIFACFKRKLKSEIKVAQLAGYVAEHSAYHHGETSLCQTIVTLAQNFVGSNNINLLLPIGQFGTRNQGGKEAASARYIFTSLNQVTRYLFHEDDDAVLNYLEEEGQSIEPDYYLPIIPMSLVNGAEGIGTGWSTNIPCHNPKDIVENLKRLMDGKPLEPMHPWYKGFIGKIEPQPGNKNYIVSGVYNMISDDELEITELPIGKWTRDYKTFLEELMTKDEIEDIREYHQENRVHFIVKVPKLAEIAAKEGIDKKFKLSTSLSINNYVLFDYNNKIRRYTQEEIMHEFFVLRKTLYEKRKEYLLAKLRKEYETISNKVKFILGVISEEIKVNKIKKKVILQNLKRMGFKTQSELNEILPEKKKLPVVTNIDEQQNEEAVQEEEVVAPGEIKTNEYDYLLTMPIMNLTEEKVEDLLKTQNEKKLLYDKLEGTHIYSLWKGDLDQFLVELQKYEDQEEKDRQAHTNAENKGKGAKKGKGPTKKPVVAKKQNGGKELSGSAQKKPPQQKTLGEMKQNPPKKKDENDVMEMSLKDRLMKQNKGTEKQQIMSSVLKVMSPNEKEAYQNGNRKRRLIDDSASPTPRKAENLQRKKVNAPVTKNDEDKNENLMNYFRERQQRKAVEDQQKKKQEQMQVDDKDSSVWSEDDDDSDASFSDVADDDESI